MLKQSIRSLIFLGLISVGRAAVDLTPTVSEYVAEGAKFQVLRFVDGKQRIEYEPPRAWAFEGGSNHLRLQPAKKTYAEATIDAVPLGRSQRMDESAAKAVEEQFVAGLPPGSQFVKVEQRTQNFASLNSRETLDITVSYQVMGEKFLRSALVVNLPDTQLIFRFTARKDDFDSLQRDFRMSLGSWHWIDATDMPAQAATAAPTTSSR